MSPDLDVWSSGELLYFTSGFLTLQLEIQNYFSYLAKSSYDVKTSIFSQITEDFLADELKKSKYVKEVS